MQARGWFFSLIVLCGCLFTFVEGHPPSAKDIQAVGPYLLPEHHPIKSKLDQIFRHSRATFNLDTLLKAGFSKSKPREFTKLVVTRHPSIPGYIFKIYLDSQCYHKDKPEHLLWMKRIQGADTIRQVITEYGFEDQFKVPRKWIYPLPKHPPVPAGYYPKYYILVEEDMELLSDQENLESWASHHIDQEFLTNLYTILTEAGFWDCKPANLAFSIDGRVAFVDTEGLGCKSVKYDKLIPFLSKSNQDYWKRLTGK